VSKAPIAERTLRHEIEDFDRRERERAREQGEKPEKPKRLRVRRKPSGPAQQTQEQGPEEGQAVTNAPELSSPKSLPLICSIGNTHVGRTRQDDPRAEQVAKAIVILHLKWAVELLGSPEQDLEGLALFRLARAFAVEFGLDVDPHWFRPFVMDWSVESHGLSCVERDRSSELETWCKFLTRFRSIRLVPGQAWASAKAAVDDDGLSLGLDDPRLDRLARLFRWLGRFHGGQSFNLTYELMADALGLTSVGRKVITGRLAHRLVVDKLLEQLDRGSPHAKGERGRASEWRWIGPL